MALSYSKKLRGVASYSWETFRIYLWIRQLTSTWTDVRKINKSLIFKNCQISLTSFAKLDQKWAHNLNGQRPQPLSLKIAKIRPQISHKSLCFADRKNGDIFLNNDWRPSLFAQICELYLASTSKNSTFWPRILSNIVTRLDSEVLMVTTKLKRDPKTQISVSIFDIWPGFWIIFAMQARLAENVT